MNSPLKKTAALGGLAAFVAFILLFGACDVMTNPGNTPGSPEVKQQGTYALNIVKEGAPLTAYTFPAVYPGYGDVAAFEALVTNTGSDTAEKIAVSLSGVGADSFTLSTGTILRLEPGAGAVFTVQPKTGLAGGEYHATVSFGSPSRVLKSFTVSFTVSTTALYGLGIEGVDGEAHTFTPRGINYQDAETLTVTVTNIGNEETGALSVSLDGENAGSFRVSAAGFSGLASGENGTFTVQPLGGLPAGSYTAAITVSGANELRAAFTVDFNVFARIDISTPEELAEIGNKYPADGNYALINNLILDSWTPLTNTKEAPFTGSFDGGDHTIAVNSFDPAALNTGEVRGYIGIFGYIQGGSIRDLAVALNMPDEQSLSAGKPGRGKDQYVGGVSGYAEDTEFEGIRVSGAINLSKADAVGIFLGGVTGYLKGGFLTSSEIKANLKSREPYSAGTGPAYTGGLAGKAELAAISESRIAGNISAYSDRGTANAGGATGYTSGSTLSLIAVSAEVEGSVSERFDGIASFTNRAYVGGITGILGGLTVSSQISESYSTGSVTAITYAPIAGGNWVYVGGIAGMTGVSGQQAVIENCYSRGAVTVRAETGSQDDVKLYAGGLVGKVSLVTLRNSYAAGVVTADGMKPATNYTHAGGIAAILEGYADGTVTIQGCAALSPQINWRQFTKDDDILKRIVIRSKFDSFFDKGLERFGKERYPQSTTLLNNIANAAMVINYEPSAEQAAKVPPPIVPVSDPNGEDGEDCADRPLQKVYEGIGWDFNTVWTMGSDGYPVLRNNP